MSWSDHHARGFSTFPLHPRSKTPALKWEPCQTKRLDWSAWYAGDWNYAVATGAVSGVVVVDTDSDEADRGLRERGAPETLTIATPRGRHRYYAHPGYPVSNRANVLKPDVRGVDIRGDGGYVVGPGSFYVPTDAEAAKGKIAGAYVIELDVPIAPLPEWLAELLRKPPVPDAPPVPQRVAETTAAYGRRALESELADLAASGDGAVNDTLNAAAFAIGQLVAGGDIREDEARESIEEVMAGLGIADEEKAQGTYERGWAAGFASPRSGQPALTPDEAFGVPTVATPGDQAPAVVEPARTYAPYLNASDLPTYFRGCVYVSSLDKVFLPSGRLVGKSAFDTHYGGHQFAMTYEGDKASNSAWECFRLSQVYRPPIADDLCFRPECPPGAVLAVEDRFLLNTYTPLSVRRVAGDPAPFLDFLSRLLPDPTDQAILLAYMSAMVQNPGRKFQWWPVVQGVEGNGKTTLLRCMSYAVGERYTHLVNPDAMAKTGNQFNSWIEGHLFVGIEEIHMADRRSFLESFKTTVTNDRMPIEGKGLAQRTGDNRANGIMLTNHRDAIPVTVDSRRYAIFYAAQQSEEHLRRDGLDGPYFPRLYDWLRADGFAIVAHLLATHVPDERFNPAGQCQRAPATSSTRAAQTESLGRAELEVLEATMEGRAGFAGGWVSSTALAALFDDMRARINRNQYAALMASLGYALHPGLPDGRATTILQPGNSKPRLYVTHGHLSLNLQTPAEICAAYSKVQSVISGEVAGAVFKSP